MSERPTLTIAVRCPTCGGTGEGKITRSNVPYGNSGNGTFIWHGPLPKCPDCTDGTIRQAVKCGGCAKWTSTHSPESMGMCRHFGGVMWIGFGCLAWQAKEGA